MNSDFSIQLLHGVVELRDPAAIAHKWTGVSIIVVDRE